jgi:hypothetical protein
LAGREQWHRQSLQHLKSWQAVIRSAAMKITVNVDCTPEEARAFLGLPDFGPMQREVMDALRERMMKAMAGTDPEALLKTWLTTGTQTFEQMQKAFWDQFGGKK